MFVMSLKKIRANRLVIVLGKLRRSTSYHWTLHVFFMRTAQEHVSNISQHCEKHRKSQVQVSFSQSFDLFCEEFHGLFSAPSCVSVIVFPSQFWCSPVTPSTAPIIRVQPLLSDASASWRSSCRSWMIVRLLRLFFETWKMPKRCMKTD